MRAARSECAVRRAPCALPVKRVPPIVDHDILTDMGRMTVRLFLEERHGYSRIRLLAPTRLYSVIETAKASSREPYTSYATSSPSCRRP